MNVTNKYIIFALLLFINAGCSGTGSEEYYDEKYFNGDIVLINDIPVSHRLQAEELPLPPTDNSLFNSYDSLIILRNLTHVLPANFNIYDIKNNRDLGDYLLRGRGPEETTPGLTNLVQIYEYDKEAHSVLWDVNTYKLFFWNISRSVAEQKTVFDKIVELRPSHTWATYNRIYYIDDNEVILIAPPTALTTDRDMVSLPVIERRNIYDEKPDRFFEPFKQTVKASDDGYFPARLFFNLVTTIKPDKKLLVQGMTYLNQFHIINLDNGKITGYRIKKSNGFSMFEKNINDVTQHYYGAEADDDYIFFLYHGSKYTPPQRGDRTIPSLPDQVHVFDWNGKFITKIKLDHEINDLRLDAKNKILYGKHPFNEVLYKYNVGFLYE